MKRKIGIAIILLVFGISSLLMLGTTPIPLVRAETFDEVGTYFEITNSMYLNITLTSTVVVRVLLESVPRMVCFFIESTGLETTTDLTFTGFESNTTYYRYQDGYFIEDFTTDSFGGFTYTQDISEAHHVVIQEDQMTLYIRSDYTFTKNISETIVVAADNIVIDGNGYTLQGPSYGMGFYLMGRSGVTIKNVVVKGWTYGINLQMSWWGGNDMLGNTILNNVEGVRVYLSVWTSVSGNTISNNGKGIHIFSGGGVSIEGNTISNNNDGIYIEYISDSITVDTNNISNNTRGIYLSGSYHNVISNNVLSFNSDGIYFEGTDWNNVYHNSFINNGRQAYCWQTFTTEWDDGYPSGGNYWSDYAGDDLYSGPGQDEPESDGIGDTPYAIQYGNMDNYPLMKSRAAETSLHNEQAIIESWDLDNNGFEKSLTSKIDDAIQLIEQGNINGAIHKLGDLIDKVTNDAKHLTQEQKDYIIQTTQEIIDFYLE